MNETMTKFFIRMFMAVLMFWTSISAAAVSTVGDLGAVGDIKAPQQASEYIFRSSPKESLISVQLLGGVQKPGIYYVPTNTDLLKLLTLAGGSNSNGDFTGVMVRKTQPQEWSEVKSPAVDEHKGTYEVDVQQLIQQGGASTLRMNHDDLVYVPPKESLVSAETSRTVTMVSVAMSIVLTGLLISQHNQKKD